MADVRKTYGIGIWQLFLSHSETFSTKVEINRSKSCPTFLLNAFEIQIQAHILALFNKVATVNGGLGRF